MKLCQWNIENLFLLMDKYQGEDLSTISNEKWQSFSIGYRTSNKHIQKIEDAAKVIEDINADIYMLCEVGGKESLNNFNKYFLNNKYTCILEEGTAKRGLDVGFLIKKDFNQEIEVINNKRLKLKDGTRFSRSLGEIRIKKGGKVELVFLLAHLKSKRTSEEDFQGWAKRSEEVKGLNQYVEKLNKDLKNPKIVLAGDLNSDLDDLRIMGLSSFDNFLDLKELSDEEKCTHIHFDGGGAKYHQFDYIFSTENMRGDLDLENSSVYRFKNDYGDTWGFPESIKEKWELPSDHYPVVLKINY